MAAMSSGSSMVSSSDAPDEAAGSSVPVVGLVLPEFVESGALGTSEAPVNSFAADKGSAHLNERLLSGKTEAGGIPPCIPITPLCPALPQPGFVHELTPIALGMTVRGNAALNHWLGF